MDSNNIAGGAEKRKNISRLRRKFFHLGGVPSQWRALRYRSAIGTVLVVGADEEARSRAAWTVTALAIAWAPTARTMVAS